MKYAELFEDSPYTLVGSFSDDLQYSKAWLCLKLKQILAKTNFSIDTITALGSWYGNLGIFLDQYKIDFNNLILLDLDQNALKISETILGNSDKYKILTIVRDANSHYYKDLTNQCVINTSVNDMQNAGWYDRIPDGSLVALQARNMLNYPTLTTDDLFEFDELFPMTKVYFRDQIFLSDPETDYFRYMKIGIK